MTNIIHFDGFGDNADIRVTKDGRYSVYDVIKFCGKGGVGSVWQRLVAKFPALEKTPRYKFSGQGSRETPVFSLPEVFWLIRFLSGDTNSVSCCPQHFLEKGAFVTEFAFRDALKLFYEECDEVVESEVRCPVGIADLVTTSTVIEVKEISMWKQAIGQSIVYSMCLSLYPEVAFYGDSRKHDFNLVLEYCTSLRVACSIWDLADGTAFRFLLGKGSWSVTNQDAITRVLQVEKTN